MQNNIKSHKTTHLLHLFMKLKVILGKIAHFIVKETHRLHNSVIFDSVTWQN